MEDKARPLQVKNHPDFWKLLKDIQTERVEAGKEDVQSKIALWKLTKTIANLVRSNKEIHNSLVEVDIKNV